VVRCLVDDESSHCFANGDNSVASSSSWFILNSLSVLPFNFYNSILLKHTRSHKPFYIRTVFTVFFCIVIWILSSYLELKSCHAPMTIVTLLVLHFYEGKPTPTVGAIYLILVFIYFIHKY